MKGNSHSSISTSLCVLSSRIVSSHLSDEPHGQQQQAEQEPVVLEVNVVHHEQPRVEQDQQADVGGARFAWIEKDHGKVDRVAYVGEKRKEVSPR